MTDADCTVDDRAAILPVVVNGPLHFQVDSNMNDWSTGSCPNSERTTNDAGILY